MNKKNIFLALLFVGLVSVSLYFIFNKKDVSDKNVTKQQDTNKLIEETDEVKRIRLEEENRQIEKIKQDQIIDEKIANLIEGLEEELAVYYEEFEKYPTTIEELDILTNEQEQFLKSHYFEYAPDETEYKNYMMSVNLSDDLLLIMK